MSNNIKNNKIGSLTNQSGFYNSDSHSENIFDNIYLILFLFFMGLAFIGYAVYAFILSNSNAIIFA